MATVVRVGLRIPYEQNTELILLANKRGISKNALILEIIYEFLDKEKERRMTDEGTETNRTNINQFRSS